jgi:hypothetical protein
MREPNKKTAKGFTKAKYISDEELESIFSTVAEGKPIGVACRKAGTSTTQFLWRVRREPELTKRLDEAKKQGNLLIAADLGEA